MVWDFVGNWDLEIGIYKLTTMNKSTFLIATIIGSALAINVHASTLFFMPQGAQFNNQETFIQSLYLDAEEKEINAIEAKVAFDPEILEVSDIIKGDSLIKFWAKEPDISNSKGEIEFAGGVPGGYKNKGIVFGIIFKAKRSGDCGLGISGAKILLNDGKSTEDETVFLESDCKIVEKDTGDFIKIKSKTHPSPEKWYSGNTPHFHWDLVEGTEYSYILSKDPLADPDEIADKPEGKLIWMGDMSYERELR